MKEEILAWWEEKGKEKINHFVTMPHNPLNPSMICTLEDAMSAPWIACIVLKNLCQKIRSKKKLHQIVIRVL
jgi:hypothetical protein